MRTKTQDAVPLGSLDLMETFKFPGDETIYRTITYRPSVCHTKGTRWCLNLTTNIAQWFYCRKKVFKQGPFVKGDN